MTSPLLNIENLTIDFTTETRVVRAIANLSLTLHRGEILGVVGESGSGKSTASLAIMRLLGRTARVSGSITFQPQGEKAIALLSLSEREMEKIRGGKIAMIFQDPLSSLNPVYTCGSQVMEAIQLHEKVSEKEAYRRALSLLDEVKLPDPTAIMKRYPYELSGGQIQRVMIAMALAVNPAILIADEPTTALDVTIQATILSLLKEIRDRRQMSILFITHDLGVVAEMADAIAVLYRGELMEYGKAHDIFTNPQHPYTKGLLACRPRLDQSLRYLPTVADFMEESLSSTGELILREKTTAVTATLQPEITLTEQQQRLSQLQTNPPILEVNHLRVAFPIKGLLGRVTHYVHAVNDVSFAVYPGETLGLVGESGCGKTTLGRSLLRLIEPTSGQILFEGEDITHLPQPQLRQLRRDLQMIFQDPYSALDSRMTIGKAVMEPLRIHLPAAGLKSWKERATYLLERVGLKADFMNRYPHELSGGQCQRVCIARALALNPKFIICDESVSALDVSVQAQVLNLLRELQAEFKLTYIFISHDLSVVKFLSDRIMVMNRGQIEEINSADSIFQTPTSDYTRRLIQSTPDLN
ncbi:ABC transporter ATP-binding protein [Oscillatoria sp. FACHB-1407]|uniref:ABC transporter ATP-binding protein n=1 Tax=Oscillatoria sp. FACHB-1407 TaxID=2692847 RepID=UPI0016834E61|nr:ABC transporter ATP-binding protein [Oscillatoria sp. FACHB-1407]MBD2463717.1 ABC transporter ATP-binding protein [Oscillatoria sp. FACHB-1407]